MVGRRRLGSAASADARTPPPPPRTGDPFDRNSTHTPARTFVPTGRRRRRRRRSRRRRALFVFVSSSFLLLNRHNNIIYCNTNVIVVIFIIVVFRVCDRVCVYECLLPAAAATAAIRVCPRNPSSVSYSSKYIEFIINRTI